MRTGAGEGCGVTKEGKLVGGVKGGCRGSGQGGESCKWGGWEHRRERGHRSGDGRAGADWV